MVFDMDALPDDLLIQVFDKIIGDEHTKKCLTFTFAGIQGCYNLSMCAKRYASCWKLIHCNIWHDEPSARWQIIPNPRFMYQRSLNMHILVQRALGYCYSSWSEYDSEYDSDIRRQEDIAEAGKWQIWDGFSDSADSDF